MQSTKSTNLQLPETGFVRIWQIIGDEKRGIPPVIPVQRTCWYAGIKEGRFPAPVKLSKHVSLWRVEDIRALIDRLGHEGDGAQ